MTRTHERPPETAGRAFSERLHRIRDAHIEVESILQSLAALQDESPCARCTSVCCKEAICRESVDSDFLRFVLGPRVEAYSVTAGWHVPGAGCRLSYGRPLVCYEYFCERFDTQDVRSTRPLSRALKQVYANAFAGQSVLVVEDISRISANKLRIIHGRLEALRDLANAALRQSLSEKSGVQSTRHPVDSSGLSDLGSVQQPESR
jgi:hypothetical protein